MSALHSQAIIIHPWVLVGGTQTFIIIEARYALGQPSSPSHCQWMPLDQAPPIKSVHFSLWIKTQRCKQMRIETHFLWQWDQFTIRSSLGATERAIQKPCLVLGSVIPWPWCMSMTQSQQYSIQPPWAYSTRQFQFLPTFRSSSTLEAAMYSVQSSFFL